MRAGDNPFRTERILQVRYRLAGSSWGDLLARCAALRYRGALIGPRGSGKTTLLEDLAPRLRERGFETHFLRLDEEHPAFSHGFLRSFCSALWAKDIVLFDGAEQMDALAWRWFLWRTRAAGGLVITTHRAGRLPALWECHTTPDLLACIAADLLNVRAEVTRGLAEVLFRKHRGNLREALREWYDCMAELEYPARTAVPVRPRDTDAPGVPGAHEEAQADTARIGARTFRPTAM